MLQLVKPQQYSVDQLLRSFRRQPDPRETMARDLGLLALRVTTGALLAGHGAQKLFGAFNGPGVEGMGGHLESMGLKPGKGWATLAGLGEFGGGVLTALGLATPLGLLGVAGSMAMAIDKVHPLTKPIWVTEGGAELPLTNLAIVAALELAGPGRYSLDTALGLRIPRWVTLGGLALTAAVVTVGVLSQPDESASQDAEPKDEEGRDEVVETTAKAPKASKPRGKRQKPDVVAAASAEAETRRQVAETAG
jgi:putative oxidoreductase